MGLEAVVVTPRTALFLTESEDAEVSEYKSKGDIVFIHGYYNTDVKNFDDEINLTKFYRSLDRVGRPVFIRSQDVFIYFEDSREIDSLSQ